MSENHCRDCCCARSWQALGITENTGMSIVEHIEQLRAQLDEARAELARWATWGTIEVAIRNPNVASYIEHWEKRALSAEAERDALRAAVEAHNARCHNDMNAGELMPETWPTEYLIPLLPSAAPAASEPKRERCKHGVPMAKRCGWCADESENEVSAAPAAYNEVGTISDETWASIKPAASEPKHYFTRDIPGRTDAVAGQEYTWDKAWASEDAAQYWYDAYLDLWEQIHQPKRASLQQTAKAGAGPKECPHELVGDPNGLTCKLCGHRINIENYWGTTDDPRAVEQQSDALLAGSIPSFGHCIKHGAWSRASGYGCPGCNGEVERAVPSPAQPEGK